MIFSPAPTAKHDVHRITLKIKELDHKIQYAEEMIKRTEDGMASLCATQVTLFAKTELEDLQRLVGDLYRYKGHLEYTLASEEKLLSIQLQEGDEINH